MKKYLFSLLFVPGSLVANAQQNITIGGVIKSRSNGETAIGASVKVDSIAGTLTNEYGFYSLTVPAGRHTLLVSAVGLQPSALTVDLNADTTINIALEEESTNLQEVVVKESGVGGGRSLRSAQTSVEKLSMKEISNIPMLLGEKDVLKAVQLLPGIQPAGESDAGLFVRGGGADQNLILLDDAPVYNASHALGLFSTFNTDALKDITVYKGGMPAQYGGRLSSVMDIKMNDGNNQKLDVSGGLGLISSKLTIEGPLQKDKSSFLISARRTYADLILKLLGQIHSGDKFNFYDLNGKVNYIFGNKDRLYISGYYGEDNFFAGQSMGDGAVFGNKWSNATATLRWNHIFGNKLFSNTSFIFSNYSGSEVLKTEGFNYNIDSKIRDLNFKEELQWSPDNRNAVRIGLNVIHHSILPGGVNSFDGTAATTNLQRRYSLENALYASNNWKATDHLNVSYGLRLSAFAILGKGDFYNLNDKGVVKDTVRYASGALVKTYLNFEPRLSGSFELNSNSSVKASYARNSQNIHMVSNLAVSTPTDRWVASSNNIKPETSDQVALGYYRNLDLGKHQYELTVEIYYKNMNNVLDYRDGANIAETNDAIETQLLSGKGRAYGIEFLFKKKTGRLTGWVSYTLSKTERKINGINNNLWYNAHQDRTHDIEIAATYQASKKWTLSANWVYYTGAAFTGPAGKYEINGGSAFYYTDRNNFRMPAYHRLDLGATLKLKQTRKWNSELSFSLYNAYGHANPFLVSFESDETDPSKIDTKVSSLFNFIPSISYHFNF